MPPTENSENATALHEKLHLLDTSIASLHEQHQSHRNDTRHLVLTLTQLKQHHEQVHPVDAGTHGMTMLHAHHSSAMLLLPFFITAASIVCCLCMLVCLKCNAPLRQKIQEALCCVQRMWRYRYHYCCCDTLCPVPAGEVHENLTPANLSQREQQYMHVVPYKDPATMHVSTLQRLNDRNINLIGGHSRPGVHTMVM